MQAAQLFSYQSPSVPRLTNAQANSQRHAKTASTDNGHQAELDGNTACQRNVVEVDAEQEVVEVEGRYDLTELSTLREPWS